MAQETLSLGARVATEFSQETDRLSYPDGRLLAETIDRHVARHIKALRELKDTADKLRERAEEKPAPPVPKEPAVPFAELLKAMNGARGAGVYRHYSGAFEPVVAIQWNGLNTFAVREFTHGAAVVLRHDELDLSGAISARDRASTVMINDWVVKDFAGRFSIWPGTIFPTQFATLEWKDGSFQWVKQERKEK